MPKKESKIDTEKGKKCPFCGKRPEICTSIAGPYKGLKKAFHRCDLMGYMEVSYWDVKVDFTKWNTRKG